MMLNCDKGQDIMKVRIKLNLLTTERKCYDKMVLCVSIKPALISGCCHSHKYSTIAFKRHKVPNLKAL